MTHYRSRFAPTPSGPLHFGSLFAAVVSYLDARAHDGQWLVRIDDLDPPREQPGAATAILNTLEKHGLHWDGSVSYQSQNHDRYLENLERLQQQERLFWCDCSRRELSHHLTYPGYCRDKRLPRPDHAIRLRINPGQDRFHDLFQGPQQAQIDAQYGDVVLRRRDGLFAYQLAVVSDDIAEQISHVIRGIDLMASVFWQRELYRALDNPTPVYGHFAVLYSAGSEQKLSKQNMAPAVVDQQAVDSLLQVFLLLGLDIERDQPEQMLRQATGQWQREGLQFKQKLQLK